MRKFKITVNGNTYEVAVEEMSATSTVSAPASAVSAPVPTSVAPVNTAPVTAPAAPAPAAPVKNVPANGTPLKAPMPGTIVKIVAPTGTAVKKGDVVVVLEAMKMENDIVSPADGVVNISVNQGANVNSGDVIAIIG
ncbi:MAG TPA: biotin/lipoyl-containing protein [Clostridia bacterium]